MQGGIRSSAPVAILGVPFDRVTTAQAVESIETMIALRRPHYLATANVDFLTQARQDVELRRILCEADMVLCDGTPLVWASRLLGHRLPERVAGADLVPLLIRVASEKGYRLFFLGATPESAQKAVAKLLARHPRLQIAGFYSPPFNRLLEMRHEEICRRIQEARPDLLFVCFGCPKQEKWIAMHYRRLGVPVIMGVGATVDFLAGQVRRAPGWMQRAGLEWVFRLFQEPRRLLGRYSRDLVVFAVGFLAQWWVEGGEGVSAEEVESRLRGSVLDLRGLARLDSAGLGALLRLRKRLEAEGRPLVLLGPEPAVLRVLTLARVEELFFIAPNEAVAEEWLAHVETEQGGGVVAGENGLAWRGQITASNAELIWNRTRNELSGNVWRVDLAGVRFIDSTGLGLMVRLKKLARQRKAQLSFVQPQPAVRNVMRMARLEEFLLKSDGQAQVSSGKTATRRSAASEA